MIIRGPMVNSLNDSFYEFMYGGTDTFPPLLILSLSCFGNISATVAGVLLWDNLPDFSSAYIPLGICIFIAIIRASLRAYEAYSDMFMYGAKEALNKNRYEFYVGVLLLALGFVIRVALFCVTFALFGLVFGIIFLIGRRIING